MDGKLQFILRPGRNDERAARYRLVEQAWRSAYTHIYSTEEIDGVFNGSIPSYGDWVERRKQHIEHIAAEVDGQMVGFTSLARLKDDEGEISALYLLPAYQRHGIGKALWEAGCKRLRELGCHEVWVWTIARADAVQFYEWLGCVQADEGVYEVGEHKERAVGFRLEMPSPELRNTN
jgi:GNAT superfamily N-acetyltransferase